MSSLKGTAAAPPRSVYSTGQGLAGTGELPAGVRPNVAMPSTAPVVPVKTTIRNPDYDAWVKKYGDGSQVQTAATGGMITKDQLAAIQNVSNAVQKPIVKAPPAPPKTVTVTTYKQVTPPKPVQRPAVTAPTRSESKSTSWGQSKTASDGTSWAANW
jgi:hypothetical protein